MNFLLIVDDSKNWKLEIPNVEIVSANSYLTDSKYSEKRKFKVFNLCKSYRYQSYGYYVSLLAEARWHKPVPSISTIQDMKSNSITKITSEEIEEIIQSSLKDIKSNKFVLKIYFGENNLKKYEKLSHEIFTLFYTPFLRVTFSYNHPKWSAQSVIPIPADEIPEEDKEFVMECARRYFSKKRIFNSRRKNFFRYNMAILYNGLLEEKPSNRRAINKFIKLAETLGIESEIITKEDYSRIPEFDILFIRETTAVNNHTYRFSRRASAEGLSVLDDPESILKCCNKVYLTEILKNNNISIPKTLIVKKNNGGVDEIINQLGFPVVLKKPDSSFSLGVKKAENKEELTKLLSDFFENSDLVICQEYVPTSFDWRIGVLNKKPLFACRYYMAKKYWQILKKGRDGKTKEGDSDTIPIEQVPKKVLKEALRAAKLIGDGLYGVDIKETNGKVYVIEINDNPNIDAGTEDKVLGKEVYLRILNHLIEKLEHRK